MTNQAQTNINAFSSDKFKISLSNLPSLLESVHNLSFLLETFTKGITIPEISLEFIQSKFFGSSINHPISQKNDQLQSFTWQLKLDENCLNYYWLYEYVQQIKFGKLNRTKPIEVRDSIYKKDSLIRKYDINVFNVLLLDNQRITKKILSFNNCFIESVGSLNLTMGESQDVLFDVTLKYETAFLNDPPS